MYISNLCVRGIKYWQLLEKLPAAVDDASRSALAELAELAMSTVSGYNTNYFGFWVHFQIFLSAYD